MYAFFTSLLMISIVCSGVIVLLAIISRLLNRFYKANWRCIIWAILILRLLVPASLPLERIDPIVIPKPDEISIPKSSESTESTDVLAEQSYTNIINNNIIIDNNIDGINKNIDYSNDIVNDAIYIINQPNPNSFEQFMSESSLGKSNTHEYLYTHINPLDIFVIIWLVGASVASVMRLVQYLIFRHAVHNNTTRITDKSMINLLNRIKYEACISKNITLYYADNIPSPMITGIFKPQLLLPKIDYTDSELYVVFRHELTHIKSHHLEVKLLMLLCEIVHWFNPFAYIMTRLLNRDLELACDANVMKLTSNSYKEEYSHALLSVMKKVNAVAT